MQESNLKEEKNLERQGSFDASQSNEMDILSLLHKKKLYIIENDFQNKEKGLTQDEFVKVMLEHLDYDKENEERRLQITLGLIDLFKEIDVNGDETMEWEEFSNHIIELGLLRKDRTFRNVIKNYNFTDAIKDREKHETDIEKVYFFEKIKSLIVLERDSSKFKVYNSNNCELLCEVNAHKGAVLAAEFLPDQNLIATSSNDLTVNFWDTSSFNLKQILSTPEIQLVIRYAKWSNTSQLLYTGGSDAIIHIYDANTLKEKGTMSGWNPFFKKDVQQYGHAGPIGDILPIYKQSTLVTAALDGKICLWDVPTHTFKKELQGHDKGVYSLDWSDWSEMNQCLISAGLDHEACVWNTYVKEKIFSLRGHNHPLVGVKCLPDSPQVITADISGMVKIWDVRNFIPMQTFNVPTDELSSFTISYPKKRIIAAARHLAFYEYDEPKDQFLTDEKICMKVLYNDVMQNFITLHPDSIKVWDAKEGKLLSVHRELSKNELTQCILDFRQRKLFVGDSGGRLFTVNIKNGAKMKKFEKHENDAMVTDLAYWTSTSLTYASDKDKDLRRIVSISQNPEVFIHDEDSSDPKKSCRYKMVQHRKSCNALSIKLGTELLASCSDDGSIVTTNLLSYRQELVHPRHPHEIKKILFLDPHNCLCASDSLGNVLFFSVHNSKLKNKLLTKLVYKTTSATNTFEQFPVNCMAYYDVLNYLVIGDEFGNVTIWDLSDLLNRLKEFNMDDKKAKKGFQLNQTWQNKEEPDEEANQEGELGERKSKDLSISKDSVFPLTGVETVERLKKTKAKKEDMILFDEEESLKKFVDVEIKQILQKKLHMDGITHIEVLQKYKSFSTSSFDCCCHIWNFDDFKKIGSLILGQDKNWALRIDEREKRELHLSEAKETLKRLDEIDYDEMIKFGKEKEDEEEEEEVDESKKGASASAGKSKSQKMMNFFHEKEFGKTGKKPEEKHQKPAQPQTKREQVFTKARDVLKKFDSLKQNDWKEELDVKGFELRMGADGIFKSKDLFQEENEEENDYHILADLNDFNKNATQPAAFTSKNAFKSKFASKGHSKLKLK